jgi:hypothetical protein
MYCIICKIFLIVNKDEIKEIRFKRKFDICNERFEMIIKRRLIIISRLIIITFNKRYELILISVLLF